MTQEEFDDIRAVEEELASVMRAPWFRRIPIELRTVVREAALLFEQWIDEAEKDE